MKILTQKQTDKLFVEMARDAYDAFVASAVVGYITLFPEQCGEKNFDNALYDKVRERLMVELQVLYAEARGEKNIKRKLKKTVSSKSALVT